MNIEEIERELVAAIEADAKQGGSLKRGIGSLASRCPLQVLTGVTFGYQRLCQERFGWSNDQASAFIDAFDEGTRGCSCNAVKRHPAIAAVAYRLAARYVDNVQARS